VTNGRRLLFSWIGDADLLAWAATGAEAAEAVSKVLVAPGRKVEGSGPIRTLADQVAFDEIHLLSDKPRELVRGFGLWLGPHARTHQVKLSSPVDYAEIFEAADGVLKSVLADVGEGASISIHLSPGTPAMTAIWVLLGKSRYPANFYQTFKSKVIPTRIPFDLLVDYLPGVLQASDKLIQSGDVEAHPVTGFGSVIGKSEQIRAVVARARRMAVRDVGVLILGKSGVGKDVFARAIHAASRRSSKQFVPLNCAAVPKDLLESELFGHRKGAFTGAVADRIGAFEQADGGTLFLDEVGECDLTMQAKLLRVLQPGEDELATSRTFRRVGDDKERNVDVRVICATNRDLQAEVAAGRFREDLYYRIAALTLKVPALSERSADIPIIADHLLARVNADFAKSQPGYVHKRLSVSTKRFLSQLPWPGNVRQLQNVLLQAAVLVEGESINPSDIEAGLTDGGSAARSGAEIPLGNGFSLTEHLEGLQREFLAKAMRESGGRKTTAAKLLGYPNYQTLAAQLERLGVKW
jgi:DNA-binding NtrC family response regulator